jgi:hypothetical protein
MNLCECGCGQYCYNRFVYHHMNNLRKGKTQEQIFGQEKALLMKQSNSLKHINNQKNYHKGISNTERFGEEKAKEISDKIKLANKEMYNNIKGKTYEELYGTKEGKIQKEKRWNSIKEKNPMFKKLSKIEVFGEEKAKLIKEKISNSCKGRIAFNKGKTYEEIYGKEKAEILLENQKIIHQKYTDDELKLFCKNIMDMYNGDLTKSEFNDKFQAIKNIHPETLRLRDICTGMIFAAPNTHGKRLGHIGLNEEKILDAIEDDFGIPFERQARIESNTRFFYLDGYNNDHNIHIEINESYHKYKEEHDKFRLEEIKNILNCQTFVFNECDFL